MVAVTRRRLLAMIGAVAVAAVASSLLWTAPPQRGGKQLAIYNYSYYIDKTLLSEFEEEYGIEVIYDEFEAGEEAYAKLLAGGGGYDLIVLPDTYVRDVIRRGLVKRIEHGMIPNLRNIDERFWENPHDPGLEYSVPYAWGTSGLAVNYYYMRREGVNLVVDDWSKVFEEEYLKVLNRRAAMLEEFTEPVMAAKYYLYEIGVLKDVDAVLSDWSRQVIDRVVEILNKQKQYLRGYLGISSIIPMLVDGTLLVSNIWSGDALTAKDELENNVGREAAEAFRYVIPRPMSHLWADYMVIPRNAKNVEAAYLFINFILEPANSARIVKAVYYATSVKYDVLRPHLPSDIAENEIIFPKPEARLVQLNYTEEMLKAVNEVRSRVLG